MGDYLLLLNQEPINMDNLKLCPGCRNLLIYCENDGWHYCEYCESVEEELEFIPFSDSI